MKAGKKYADDFYIHHLNYIRLGDCFHSTRHDRGHDEGDGFWNKRICQLLEEINFRSEPSISYLCLDLL